jgi:polyisoprenoid-binding protein YceI
MTDATMTAGTRSVEGIELPVPGPWAFHPVHTDVSFVGRRFGLSRVRGWFTGVDGAVTIVLWAARDSNPEPAG